MTLQQIGRILDEGENHGSVKSIYFEGGEPFLYYPVMVRGIRMAAKRGFSVGVVTNGYWATGREDAVEWLRPLAGLVRDLSVSSDLYHESESVGEKAKFVTDAARELGISSDVISIAQPEESGGGSSPVKYKGRAAVELAGRAPQRSWREFTECPYEDLVEPGRVHVDPFGNLHICQGISIGNIFETPLAEICENYRVGSNPVTGPLHRGGPVELVERYGLSKRESYADACQMCYEARLELRSRFPEILTPDQMYGSP